MRHLFLGCPHVLSGRRCNRRRDFFRPMLEQLEDRRLLAGCFPVTSGATFQNPDNPCDVNGDGDVTATDTLQVISFINVNGSGPPPTAFQPPPFVDVDGDGSVNQEDADILIDIVTNGEITRPVVLSAILGDDSQSFIIQFNDDDLDASTAEEPANYGITAANGDANSNEDFFDEGDESSIPITQISYSPTTDQVTVALASVLSNDTFRLQLDGMAIQDLDGNGLSGGDYSQDYDLRDATPNVGIRIEKSTNGEDADLGTGPLLEVGATATFDYVVTNTGDVPLAGVIVTDDAGTPSDTSDDFNPTFVGGDTSGDDLLDSGESWVYTANRTVTPGQYTNTATATAAVQVSDADPSSHFGVLTGIRIEKTTNGEDADAETGPLLAAGSTVVFDYTVTNTGNVPLANVTVTDDNGSPSDMDDDFNPSFVAGDGNNNSLLDVNETWTYTFERLVTIGQHTNTAKVTGDDSTNTTSTSAIDSDTSNHLGVAVELDNDGDGVSDEVEDQGPNDGDANSDGTPDRDQAHVAAFFAQTPRHEPTIIANPDNRAFTNVAPVENPSLVNSPADTSFPIGFFQFELHDVDLGGEASASISLPTDYAVDTYWRFGPTPDDGTDHWYEFLFDGTVGAEILDDRVVLHFVDGGLGDDDLTANGVIRDAGAPANSFPWQNDFNPLDVNALDGVSPLDALIPINSLIEKGSRPLAAPTSMPEFYFDTSGDNFLSPIDPLLVINFLNRQPGSSEAEGAVSFLPLVFAAAPGTIHDSSSSDRHGDQAPDLPVRMATEGELAAVGVARPCAASLQRNNSTADGEGGDLFDVIDAFFRELECDPG